MPGTTLLAAGSVVFNGGTTCDLPRSGASDGCRDAFDAVFSFATLYAVPDVERVLADVARVLRPGGTALLELGNARSLNADQAAACGHERLRPRAGPPSASSCSPTAPGASGCAGSTPAAGAQFTVEAGRTVELELAVDR